MKLLFVGNSFTYYNDLPQLFERVAKENGKDVEVFSVTKGGRKLIENVDSADECTAQLNELLKNHVFDVCFIQEYSRLPLSDNALFMDALMRLVKKIGSSVNKIVLYAPWGCKEGSPVLAEYGWTTEEMAIGVARAYKKAAEEIGADVSYAGLNFLEVYLKHKDIELYEEDLKHPSYVGSCLALLTHYKTIYNEFPETVKSLSLSEGQVAVFKEVVSGNKNVIPEVF